MRAVSFEPFQPVLAVSAIVCASTGHLVAGLVLVAAVSLVKLKITLRR
jgi:hypothetical protein